jgi:excisionase family DNA binding protein
MSIADAEPLLTPQEVATLFRVDPKTVTRWAKAGKLTSIRTLGGHRRYRESEVRALLTGAERTPDPLAAPVHTLWPKDVTSSARTLLSHLNGAGVVTVGDLAACSAAVLDDYGLRPPQIDHVRLVLARKGLTLHGEILGKVA